MAVANYEPTGEGQIALVEGDFIEVTDKAQDEDGNDEKAWWYGINLRGKEEGWFPANCVQKRGCKIRFEVQNHEKKPVKPAKPDISPKLVTVNSKYTNISNQFCVT